MVHRTQTWHSFLWNNGKVVREVKRKGGKGREEKRPSWKMLVWHAPSGSARTCSTKSVKSSQESLQTAKRKEKKDKMSCKPRKESAIKNKRGILSFNTGINSEKGLGTPSRRQGDYGHYWMFYFKVSNGKKQVCLHHKQATQISFYWKPNSTLQSKCMPH